MQLSAKDKKLLVYLLAVGLIAGSYFFIARPLLDKQSTMSIEIDSLRTKVNHYSEIYNNKGEYESRVADAQTKYNETVNKFFGGLNQDNTIMLIDDLEKSSDVWIARLSFQDESVVFGGDGASEAAETIEGEEVSEQLAEENSTESSLIKGYRQDLNIDYSAKYDNFKRFIEYIQNYDERLFITSINASYAVDSGLVGGSIVLSQFAVTGTDKEYTAPDLSNIMLGNDCIFKTGIEPIGSDSGSGSQGIVVEETKKPGTEEDATDSESRESSDNDDESEDKTEAESNQQEEEPEVENPEPRPSSKPSGNGGGII